MAAPSLPKPLLALAQASGLVLRRPVMRSPSFHWPRFLSRPTRSKRLSTLRLPPTVAMARRLRCCDIKIFCCPLPVSGMRFLTYRTRLCQWFNFQQTACLILTSLQSFFLRGNKNATLRPCAELVRNFSQFFLLRNEDFGR